MKRLTTTEAAKELGVAAETVRSLAKVGYLKAITNSGTHGNGQRMYFDAAEVQAFCEGGAPAAKAYRDHKAALATIRPIKPRGRKSEVTSA